MRIALAGEANLRVNFWDIGFSACDRCSYISGTWYALNLLGQALKHVQTTLRYETGAPPVGSITPEGEDVHSNLP